MRRNNYKKRKELQDGNAIAGSGEKKKVTILKIQYISSLHLAVSSAI